LPWLQKQAFLYYFISVKKKKKPPTKYTEKNEQQQIFFQNAGNSAGRCNRRLGIAFKAEEQREKRIKKH